MILIQSIIYLLLAVLTIVMFYMGLGVAKPKQLSTNH